MEAKTVSPITEAIQKRFFTAMDHCLQTGKIKSVYSFTMAHGLNKMKYYEMYNSFKESVPSRYKVVDIDAIYFLVRDYGISAEWILLGVGEMKNGSRMLVLPAEKC